MRVENVYFKLGKNNIRIKLGFCSIFVSLCVVFFFFPYYYYFFLWSCTSLTETHVEGVPQRLPEGEPDLRLEQGGIEIHRPLDALPVTSLRAERVQGHRWAWGGQEINGEG